MFLGKGVLKICSKFTGEHPRRTAISVKLQSNFLEIALRHGCSPVKFLHFSEYLFLRTPWTNASADPLDPTRRQVFYRAKSKTLAPDGVI